MENDEFIYRKGYDKISTSRLFIGRKENMT